jgi:MFS family permease
MVATGDSARAHGHDHAGLLPAIAKLIRHSVEEHNTGKVLGYLQSAQFSGQVIGPLIGGRRCALWIAPGVFGDGRAAGVLCRNQWLGEISFSIGGIEIHQKRSTDS